MKSNKVFRVFGVLMIFALLVSSVSFPAKAQESTGATTDDAQTSVAMEAFAEAPVYTVTPNYDVLPELTSDQLAQLQWGVENTHLSVSRDVVGSASPEVAPEAGSESILESARTRSGEPLAPGTATTFIYNYFGSVIPGGYKSNVMEHSTSAKGLFAFDTGNWFAAFTLIKGVNWAYKSAYADFPDFCCDQVALHDDARDMYIWLRMGSKNASGVNRFLLSIGNAAPFNTAYYTYSFYPTNTNATWTNTWWDYPHMQLGADFLYITWNMFNNSNVWVRTVILRFPLDNLLTHTGFGYNYYYENAATGHFTWVPVSGATHTMYWASNWTLGQLRIYRWDEDSGSLNFWDRAIPSWNWNVTACGNPDWLARSDDRLLTGARYSINEEGLGGTVKLYGRSVLGWWWNAGAQTGFPTAYIEGAAFYQDTLTLVPGLRGRPYIFSNTGAYCFAYPSIAPNYRGDLAAVFNYSASGSFQKPRVAYAFADDYVQSPPGWFFYTIKSSTAGPSDGKWGDYNTSRNYMMGSTWYGASHFIYPSVTNCANCSTPLFFMFGRYRDYFNWRNAR